MAILSDSWKIDVLALLVGVSTIFYIFAKRSYSYWDRRGFKTLPGFNYCFGHLFGVFSQKAQLGVFLKQLYDSTKEPFVGIYGIFRPILIVRDPELVRSVLIKDFSHFADRGIHSNEEYDPLSGNLFAVGGQKWKNLRTKLSPTFTSGKLKGMFSTITDCGNNLQSYVEKLADNGDMLDVSEIAACYTTNVIASVVKLIQLIIQITISVPLAAKLLNQLYGMSYEVSLVSFNRNL